MFFTPNLKRKKGDNKWLLKPFPKVESNKHYEGIFTGISVEVCVKEDIISIYDNGFFGKGSQSRSTPQVVLGNAFYTEKVYNRKELEESLTLSLEEAFFLGYYLNALKIYDLESTVIEHERFLKLCLEVDKLFIETLASYLYLKSKGWVIKSGLKFGGNYLIYRKGARFYHASFVVIIGTPSDTEHFDSKNLKGVQRIAETSDKDVLFLEVHKPNDFKFGSLETISNVEITEIVIRRFNCTSYIQTPNIIK